jgi:MFS family permease
VSGVGSTEPHISGGVGFAGAGAAKRGPLAGFFALGLVWGGWAALVPAIQTAVGASKGELGLALLFVALGALPAMIVTGGLVDRHGARVLPVAVTGLAVAAVLPALAGSVAGLAAALLALGIASGAVDVAINGAVAELEARRSTRLMQIAHALFSAGVLVGAIGVGLAREAGAGRLVCLASVAAVVLGIAALNLGHERVAARAAAARRPRLSRAAIPLGIACAAAFLIEGGIESWSALFLERELDSRPAVGALGPAAYGGAMMLGRLSGQWLERLLGDTLLLGCAAAVSGAGLVAAAVAPTAPVAIAAFFLGGAGVSIAAPALLGAAGRRAEAGDRGASVATVTTIGYLGFLVGPPLVGAAAEAIGLRAAFAALALVAAALAAATPKLGLGRAA